MDERLPDTQYEGEMPPEEPEKARGGTDVPVPEDFPEQVTVSRPPGLSIEEQRRKFEEKYEPDMRTGIIKKRSGGDQSTSTHIA